MSGDYTGGIGPDGYPAITWDDDANPSNWPIDPLAAPSWVTREGTRVQMSEMTNLHIANAIAFIVRKHGLGGLGVTELVCELHRRVTKGE